MQKPTAPLGDSSFIHQLEGWTPYLCKPIKDKGARSGRHIEARLGIVRSDWNQTYNSGEISFWNMDNPIFVDKNGESMGDDKDTVGIDIFIDNESDQCFTSITSCTLDSVSSYFCCEIDEENTPLLELLAKVLMQTVCDEEELAMEIAFIIEDPEERINELQDDNDNWHFAIGEGDRLYDVAPDVARSAIFLDLVFSENAPFILDDGCVNFDDGTSYQGDFRNEAQRFIALINPRD